VLLSSGITLGSESLSRYASSATGGAGMIAWFPLRTERCQLFWRWAKMRVSSPGHATAWIAAFASRLRRSWPGPRPPRHHCRPALRHHPLSKSSRNARVVGG